MLRDNFPLPFPYARVSSTQLQSHTSHLPSTTLRRSVGIEAVPLLSRACQSTSSHSPRFAPVNYLILPYLTCRKAGPRSTGRIRTPLHILGLNVNQAPALHFQPAKTAIFRPIHFLCRMPTASQTSSAHRAIIGIALTGSTTAVQDVPYL